MQKNKCKKYAIIIQPYLIVNNTMNKTKKMLAHIKMLIVRPQLTIEMKTQATSSEYSLSPSAQPSAKPSKKSRFTQLRAHCRRSDK